MPKKEGGQAGGPLFLFLFPARACFERLKNTQVTFTKQVSFLRQALGYCFGVFISDEILSIKERFKALKSAGFVLVLQS